MNTSFSQFQQAQPDSSVDQGRWSFAVVVSLFVSLLMAGPASADDRDLFRAAASSPYVFMLLDTSGSMHLQPNQDFAIVGSEDPAAKLYQAKSALYQVVNSLDPDIRLGWGHFNQAGMDIFRKHWVYKRAPGQPNPPWWNHVQFPRETDPNYLGFPSNDVSPDNFGSCGNPRSFTEVILYPKGGDDGDFRTDMWLNSGGQRFRIRVTRAATSGWGTPNVTLRVRVRRYSSDCNAQGDEQEVNMVFEPWQSVDNDGLVIRNQAGVMDNDFIARQSTGYPGFNSIVDLSSPPVCDEPVKWHPNENTATGTSNAADSPLAYLTFPLPAARYASAVCPATQGAMDRGSVIPWDWVRQPESSPAQVGFELSGRQELLCRLAPNLCVGDPTEYHVVTDADTAAGFYAEYEPGDRVPDFRIGRYFLDQPVGGELPLNPKFARYPPIAARGRTPLGGVLDAMDRWLGYWEPCAEDPITGDRDLVCRERYAILLSDGLETCQTADANGDGRNDAIVAAATKLRDRGVRTFVIGFGTGVTAAQLADIADLGGTGVLDLPVGDPGGMGDGTRDCEEFSTQTFDLCPGPIIATNKEALVAALENIFEQVNSDRASFASAAVPAGQSEAQDSIFLTDFVPLDSLLPWPGEMAHYIRPLPLRTVDGIEVPDDNKRCSASRLSACLAWKANESMLGVGGAYRQVPNEDEVDLTAGTLDNAALRIGNGASRRRLYFGRWWADSDKVGYNPPLFRVPTNESTKAHLLFDMGLSTTTDPTALPASAVSELEDVLRFTYKKKEVESPLESGPTTLKYILGDTFHSDPKQLGEPRNIGYLQANLGLDGQSDCDDLDDTSYRCFFFQHRYRRKVVFAGANDGQLHAFDAGTFDSKVVDERQVGGFNVGTGQELFGFIPNSMLRRVKEMAQADKHEYGVDGELILADVFIDPKHNGTPNVDDREWRTVLLGSLREGGDTTEQLGPLGTDRDLGADAYQNAAYPTYFALDVTQPDKLVKSPNLEIGKGGAWVPDASTYVPSCISGYNTSDCGPLRYGAVLWEFYDRAILNSVGTVINKRYPADEDNNGKADLAATWSRATIGRIKVADSSGDVELRHVAIFGGGLDQEDQLGRGNWLYMLDIETGELLYKRELEGAAPSAPAAVDTDGDSILDRVYIGTVAGFMYKVDLLAAGELDSTTGRVQASDWQPLKVIDTEKRPIYFPPSVIFVPKEDRYALSFGVGDRSDLWDVDTLDLDGRYFSVLDTGWTEGPSFEPFVMTDFENFTAADTTERDNLLSDPPAGKEKGWVLRLEPGEKLASRPFTLSGVTLFSTYIPDQALSSNTGDQAACERTGETNIFTVFTTSGNALVSDRFRTISGIVSNPFTEVSSLQGRGGFGQSPADGSPDPGVDPTEEFERCDLPAIQAAIQDFFPPSCSYNSTTIDIKLRRSDTGIECVAPIPVCIQSHNWKDLP